MRELIIAIAKGRLQAEALELLSRAGICANGDSRESRRLAIRDESGQYKLLFVKPNDVPVYVEHGIADCGIVGRDVLLEFEPDVLQPLTLNIGRCQIIVAAPEAATPSASGMLTIATKHSHIAAKHFRSRGQPVDGMPAHFPSCQLDPVEESATERRHLLHKLRTTGRV